MKLKSNILLVNETGGPGGAETIVFELATNLDPRRFNVSVVLFRSGWFLDHLQSHGAKADLITTEGGWDFSLVRRLGKYCRDNKIDLIHANLAGANLYCSVVGAIYNLPVITTAHNELNMPGTVERFSNIKNRIINATASSNVLVANFMRNSYVTRGGYNPKRLITIHNGIRFTKAPRQTDLDDLRRQLRIDSNDIVIGNVANLRTPKGHDYLVDAISIVCRKIPNIKLLIIGEEGDGTIKQNIEKKIKLQNLEDTVSLLGFRTDVPRLLHLFDIFVLASISEGLPLSVVEGMAASKPIVATDVGGIHEVVTDGKNGYLVPPANPQAMAEKLIDLVRDKELRDNMGEAGRKIALAHFSLKTMIHQYQSLYSKLIR